MPICIMKKCDIYIDPLACSRMRLVSNLTAAKMGHDNWKIVLFGYVAQCGIIVLIGDIEYEKYANSIFLYR